MMCLYRIKNMSLINLFFLLFVCHTSCLLITASCPSCRHTLLSIVSKCLSILSPALVHLSHLIWSRICPISFCIKLGWILLIATTCIGVSASCTCILNIRIRCTILSCISRCGTAAASCRWVLRSSTTTISCTTGTCTCLVSFCLLPL